MNLAILLAKIASDFPNIELINIKATFNSGDNELDIWELTGAGKADRYLQSYKFRRTN